MGGGRPGWGEAALRKGLLGLPRPRIAQRKWKTLRPRSPASQPRQHRPSITDYQHLLCSSAPFLLLLLPLFCLPRRSLQLVCVYSTRRVHKRKMGTKVGAGWLEPTMEATWRFHRAAEIPHQCVCLSVRRAACVKTAFSPFCREDGPDKSPACVSGNPQHHVLWIHLN